MRLDKLTQSVETPHPLRAKYTDRSCRFEFLIFCQTQPQNLDVFYVTLKHKVAFGCKVELNDGNPNVWREFVFGLLESVGRVNLLFAAGTEAGLTAKTQNISKYFYLF